MTTVLVRADGSTVLGMGNITRSLAIAEVFQARGCDIVFAARELDDRVRAHVEAMRCRFLPLPAQLGVDDDVVRTRQAARELGVEHVIVDLANPEATHDVARYSDYLQRIADPYRLIIVDDLTRAVFPRSVVINHNVEVTRAEYDVRFEPTILFGPSYAILRATYHHAARDKRYSDGSVRRVAISLGGGVVASELLLATLDGVRRAFGTKLHIDLVTGLGDAAPLREALAGFESVTASPIVPSLRDLLLAADVAFVSGGVTKFEAAATGTAMVIVPSIDHQESWGASFARTGCALYAGDVGKVTGASLAQLCGELHAPDARRAMGMRGAELVDGLGAERIVEHAVAR